MTIVTETLLSIPSLLKYTATLVGAAGAAASAALVIPSIVDQIAPFPRQDSVADFLPFQRMLPNRRHIALIGNRYMSIIQINGAEMTLTTDERRADLFLQRKSMLDEAHKQGIAEIRIATIKRRAPITVSNTHEQPVLSAVTERWNQEFTETYQMRHYAMLIVDAPSDDDGAEALRRAEDFFVQRMPDFGCSVLEESTNDPASGPLAVIAQIVSPISRPTPIGSGLLGNQLGYRLSADTIDFTHEERGIIRYTNGRAELFSSIIGMRDCGDKTSENAIRDILSIDADMVLFQIIKPLDTTRQMVELTREKGAAPMMTLSPSAAYEYQDALDMLDGQVADRRATIHDYALNIILYSNDIDTIPAIENEVSASLSRTGATIIREAISAPAVWFSLFPSTELWPRKFRMMSTNIASNTPLLKPSLGHTKSDLHPSEPVAYLRSLSGEPYGFIFHATDSLTDTPPGHTLLIGPTGRGKTTLVTFLASQALRFPNTNVYLFDRMNGCEIITHAAGGDYLTFGNDQVDSGMNPLLLDDTTENRSFIRQFVSLLTGAKDSNDSAEIARFTDIIFGEPGNPDAALPHKERTFIRQYLSAFSPHSRVRQGMEQWVDRANYGNFFNSEKDSMDLSSSRIIGFDMTNVLGDPILAPPLVRYLMHKINQVSANTSQKSIIFIDETAPMLQNPEFSDWFLTIGLREGRKRGQSMITAFQNPGAVAESGKQEIILGQCQTVIFLRNPAGQEAEYKAYNLTPNEMDFVLGRTHKDMRYGVLIKKTALGESAIVDADLSKLGPLLKIFNSSTTAVQSHRRYMATHGQDWVREFLKVA